MVLTGGNATSDGIAGSEAEAMDPEIARNQKYHDHNANDGKDVHLLYSDFMMMAYGVLAHRTYQTVTRLQASFRDGRLGSTEAEWVQPTVTAIAYIPNSRRLRTAETARGQ
jgi:hypothetical protein